MTVFSPLVDQLIGALRCLVGVGPKSAQRIAFDLLQRRRAQGAQLAEILAKAMLRVGYCQSCRTLCETTHCGLCANSKRDASLLCVVENPADIVAIEQTGQFRGLYFVLMGALSPLDGVGPDEIGIDLLQQRLAQGGIGEVILATNPTVEGEATAHYIATLTKKFHIKATRLASGIPLGGELELVNGNTLAHAVCARTEYA